MKRLFVVILFFGNFAVAKMGDLFCTNGKMVFTAGPQLMDYMTLEDGEGHKLEFDGKKQEIIPLVDADPDQMLPAGLAGKNSKNEFLSVTFVHGEQSEMNPLGLSVIVASTLSEQPTELFCKVE